MNFSPEQLKAIQTPGNVIVSAGAGSGKTTVMIERIIGKLKAGASLDRMLIVTFTRAAAADIRVKLAEKLAALKRSDDDATRKTAAEALDMLSVCNIGTLHSYCQRLIKTYFYAAEVDPSATVMDEGEAEAAKRAAVRAAVRAAREKRDGYFDEVCDSLSSRRDDGGAENAVSEIIDFALSLPEPRAYLSDVRSDREFDGELDRILSERRTALFKEIELLRADIAAAECVEIARAADELCDYADGKIDAVTRTSRRNKGDIGDELNARFKKLKEKCKSFREDRESAEQARKVDSAPYVKALCGAALDALGRYSARKAALGKIDYSDLEHGAKRVLSDPKCLAEISERLDYVFIDEYQDVNPLQAEIAAALKSGAKAEMFLVGDIKQSIYAFRRCNPKYFKTALTDPDYTAVYLTDNYRSSREVVDFVNNVFTGVMTDGFGGADYKSNKLVFKSGLGGGAAFYAVDGGAETTETAEAEADAADLSPYSVVRAAKGDDAPDAEVEFVLGAILDYIDRGGSKEQKAADIRAMGKPRSLSSVAVLVRSARTAFCDRLVRALRENGIAVSMGRRSAVRDYPETEALLEILGVVNNRFDDVGLYTALRSPMGGFSDAELLEIANSGEAEARRRGVAPLSGSGRKSYYFWQKVDCSAVHRARLDAFTARRERFAEYASRHDAADVIGYVTSDVDYFGHVFRLGGSAAAVEALIADAETRRLSLSAYLAQTNADTELSVSDGGDAVTVTTVHASKGLEYDFVIVADTARRFNMRDASAKVIAAESGVALAVPNSATHTTVKSTPWLIAHAVSPDRLREEELRLFYVALTRAKRELIVCGRRRDADCEKPTCDYDFMKNIAPRIAETAERSEPQKKADSVINAAVADAVEKSVAARCAFVYDGADRAIKTCVTAIAKDADGGDYTAASPVLMDDDRAAAVTKDKLVGADAGLRGTAYHRAMELIDFDDPDTEAVRAVCENAELVDFGVIERAAKAMKTLAAGATCFKERYFIVDLPVGSDGKPCPGGGCGESMLVQGVIDLLIADAHGDAVIVDYKTTAPDRLLSDGYKTQLKLYAAAIERATPFKVKKTYLYSFALEKLIELNG